MGSVGAVIALVGPEATGKSTLARELTKSLNAQTNAYTVHVGKPPTSWLTWPIQSMAPFLRRSLPRLRTSYIEGHRKSGNHAKLKQPRVSLLYATRAVCLAWDRRRLLMHSQHLKQTSGYMICDRYPAIQVGGMDGPRLTSVKSARYFSTRLFNKLADLEQRLYRDIPAPDIVFQLTVSLDTAIRRNQERVKSDKGDQHYLVSRHSLARQWQPIGSEKVYTIDTEQPLQDTLLQIKQLILASRNAAQAF